MLSYIEVNLIRSEQQPATNANTAQQASACELPNGIAVHSQKIRYFRERVQHWPLDKRARVASIQLSQRCCGTGSCGLWREIRALTGHLAMPLGT